MSDRDSRERTDTERRPRGAGSARHLTLPLLDRLPGLVHAFTVAGSGEHEVLRAVAGRALPLWTLRQVHGRTVRTLDGSGSAPWPPPGPDGDALVTTRRGEAIAIHVADCVPILLCDPGAGVLGAAHAGWRGTVAGVLGATIEAMIAAGAHRGAIHVAMGPAIGACCFEVGPEVVAAFRDADPDADSSIRPGARTRIDLLDANRRQAIAAGVRKDRIETADLCTVCRPDLLISYRRGGKGSGRMTGLIAWRA
ncbi:MAG TPA: peptidoglycan editing factor PgeF [Patescibacteria group bacterium]|nr:peptidoglycan editing factor PgeF [Patescibacteria group bacterium]